MSQLVLGLETSCDETAAAVIEDGRRILSNIISSQIPVHQKYGGVVPELASRRHVENVVPVIDRALSEAGVKLADLSAIGVTFGPGLVGALLVGVAAAKALAFSTGIPLIGVHHLEGHMSAALLTHPDLEPPFVSLVAANDVLIPVQCESMALEGLTDLLDTVKAVRKRLNPRLEVEGLLRTMFDVRTALGNDVSSELTRHFGDKVLRSVVAQSGLSIALRMM